jgi:hypothetical protein
VVRALASSHETLRILAEKTPDARTGGVAVTTYDSLRSLPRTTDIDLGLLVVDEVEAERRIIELERKRLRMEVGVSTAAGQSPP